MRIIVANIGGNDPSIDYRDEKALTTGYTGHAPINYHAYAAATGGQFVSALPDLDEVDPDGTVVCLLLTRKLRGCLQSLRAIQERGFQVYVAWKECGNFQVQQVLDSNSRIDLYREILETAEGVFYTSLDPPFLGGGNAKRLLTPYPVDLEDWDRSIEFEKREGIFLGTREWFAPGRCHGQGLSLALKLAERSGTHVTVINRDGKRGKKLYDAAFGRSLFSGQLKLVEGRQPYLDYLDLMARHRLVFQWDRSGVPGQVAGDALLCRSICLGGNSAIELEIYGHYLDSKLASEHADRLMQDASFYERQVHDSQQGAKERLSFAAFRETVPGLLG